MNQWYASLQRPALTPPDWVFTPVWSILYVMIALSVFLFLKSYKGGQGYIIYIIIALHIISNLAWTGLFFGMQSPGAALIDILFLDITLIIMVFRFWQTSWIASLLLCPYLLWVLFATYLNSGFYLLNSI